jgi:predicted alpha/beta hydrolase
VSREERQDLRAHLKPGAQGKGYGTGPGWSGAHKKKSGCPLSVLILLGLAAVPYWGGWQLASALWGAA